MRLFTFLASVLLISSAQAAQNWENCLDRVDFSFVLDGMLESTMVTKSGCQLRFGYSGGRGARYELNLCDPVIHVDYFNATDATKAVRIEAGAVGCPAPLFGANFEDNANQLEEYNTAKKRLLDSFAAIKKAYGANADAIDLSNPKSFSPEISDGKVACGQYLLREYLVKCQAFEATKGPGSAQPAPMPPPGAGIHPQSILIPKQPGVK